jgi:hypothetical protein
MLTYRQANTLIKRLTDALTVERNESGKPILQKPYLIDADLTGKKDENVYTIDIRVARKQFLDTRQAVKATVDRISKEVLGRLPEQDDIQIMPIQGFLQILELLHDNDHDKQTPDSPPQTPSR